MVKKTWETIEQGEENREEWWSKMWEIVGKASKAEADVMNVPTAKFTEEELTIIEEEKKRIDFWNANELILYGSEVSSGISAMTQKILEDDKLSSLKEIWWQLTELISGLNTLGWSKDSSKLPIIGPLVNKMQRRKISRMTAEDAINKLEDVIHEAWDRVDSYIPDLNELRENNILLIKRLWLLVEAWKQRIAEEQVEFEKKEKEYLDNDGEIDGLEKADLEQRANNIKQFTQRVRDLERVALVAFTNIAQINLIQNAAVDTRTRMQQLEETAIPIIQMQTAVSKIADDVSDINKMGTSVSDVVQSILVTSAQMTRDLATSSAKEAYRPVVEDNTFKKVVTTLIDTQNEVKRICDEWQKKLKSWNDELRKQLSGLWEEPKKLWPKK